MMFKIDSLKIIKKILINKSNHTQKYKLDNKLMTDFCIKNYGLC